MRYIEVTNVLRELDKLNVDLDKIEKVTLTKLIREIADSFGYSFSLQDAVSIATCVMFYRIGAELF